MPRVSERAGVLALAAFLVVDVLLVGFAVKSTRNPVEGGGTTIGAGTSAPVAVSRSTDPSKSPSSGSLAVVPLQVGLTVVDADTALRWSTGSCKGGAQLSLSRNGGRTWAKRPAPYDAIVRVRVRPDSSAFLVGADSSGGCVPSIRQADSYDGDFGDSQPVGDVWYRDPRTSTDVGLPGGDSGRPCGKDDVIDLAVVDSGAGALCHDGRVMVSRSGASWKASATVPGALSLALDSTGRSLLALPAAGSCTGLAVVDAAKPDSALGCVLVEPAKVKPGTVALAVVKDAGWLLIGDSTYHSGAGLADWKKAS
ncbi:hypothetical protein [Pedococcus sp. 5OH_020]|uniref:hypothetical protein n=1 Tax=Pedococcus sp. 5OH_020 TaxID=2989814 RepID=UPI0022E9D36F|nr:hypothetical protein [Pedococcus sp. 5OH_020]